MPFRIIVVVLAVAAASLCGGAGAAVTASDANGTVLLDGRKFFPIVLAKGPPAGETTPSGADAIAEVVGAGANVLKIGPATVPWTSADLTEAKLENRAAAAHGGYTWVNLATVSRATAGSQADTLLEQVVTTLKQDAGAGAIAMWKGADEPWWSGTAASALQFAFCRATGRGALSWCAGKPVLDRDHLWVTIQAPRGTSADLAPYSAVTDVHGVDIYPVTAANTSPDLAQVGSWTRTMASITPGRSVWTTLQICASGSVRADGSFVLPTRTQQRFMIYDAIVNGARSLAFYGGNNPDCWNGTSDDEHAWNWTFWNSTLKSLVSEISASSALAPALVDPGSTKVLQTSDPSTQAISRAGSAGDLWVLAARSGPGTTPVTISGLPASVSTAAVYTEDRSVSLTNGSLTDAFGQWGVHVYHLVPQAPPPPPPAPTIASISPATGPVGSTVTITGTQLASTTAVAFGGVAAGFAVVSATELSATVPAGAATGQISVTTPSGTAVSTLAFTPTAPTATAPPPPAAPVGGGGSGGQPLPPDLRLTLAAKSGTTGIGGTDDITVTAVNTGGGSSRVALTITLPSGLSLAGPPAYDRGGGCSGAAVVVCNLDFLPTGLTTRVLFSVRASQGGEQRISATISARELDANPIDNAATLTVIVAPPAATTAPAAPQTPTLRVATAGADRLVGTPRRDVLRGLGGPDTILGGAGDDLLDGGTGNDTLVGGRGRDVLYGRAGNDVLSVRDGRRDRVSCGAGRDRVIADRLDTVARDCERVSRR
jgi:hypothetical protein